MKELILFRHGKAEPHRHDLPDHQRRLAEKGGINAKDQALKLKPGAPARMIVSDALRTIQTAQAIRSAWSSCGINHLPPLTLSSEAYLATATALMELIRPTPTDIDVIWVVGHNPGISDLVTALTGDFIGMATADIVRIELTLDSWHEITPHCGSVMAHLPGRGI